MLEALVNQSAARTPMRVARHLHACNHAHRRGDMARRETETTYIGQALIIKRRRISVYSHCVSGECERVSALIIEEPFWKQPLDFAGNWRLRGMANDGARPRRIKIELLGSKCAVRKSDGPKARKRRVAWL